MFDRTRIRSHASRGYRSPQLRPADVRSASEIDMLLARMLSRRPGGQAATKAAGQGPWPHRACHCSISGEPMSVVHSRTHTAQASALALAIAFALAGTAAAQDTAPAEATRTLDRINVTGSRIKRTD